MKNKLEVDISSKIVLDIDSLKSYFSEIEIKHHLAEEYKIVAYGTTNLKINNSDNTIKAAPYEINVYDTIYLILIGVINISNQENIAIIIETLRDKLLISYFLLKSKSYYLLSGLKYGCDFMAYKGKIILHWDDPNLVHSDFLVKVYDVEETFDVIANQRISQSTKKTFLLLLADTAEMNKELKLLSETIKSKLCLICIYDKSNPKSMETIKTTEYNESAETTGEKTSIVEILVKLAEKYIKCIKINWEDKM